MGVLLFFCPLLDDKVGILDVKAKIDGHINCDIEMQVVNKKILKKEFYFIVVKCIFKVLNLAKIILLPKKV